MLVMCQQEVQQEHSFREMEHGPATVEDLLRLTSSAMMDFNGNNVYYTFLVLMMQI